ncbi:heterokaryon incompatibility protein [Aspergillus sclerotiicarbonarius CBS 121057]|uniref:Heterokaryon incompatibility protein n=1 Tax=Aspergillus sclerotiicarbonarius (strain CBS 121057 / IBT 28362) TaxID=1448318 RepID=A0A319DVT1_ASPSB|nr:heterokaryon incompatibility protein [Aspergillus sclerotiicarbonarius CBS 121057]
MAMDSEPDRDSDRACPHTRLREGRDILGIDQVSITRFFENAPTCMDCNLLLQDIEAVKPGWVAENKELGLVDYQAYTADDKLYRIVPEFKLHVQKSGDAKDVDSSSHPATFFHFLRGATNVCYEGPDREGWPSDNADYAERYVTESLDVVEDSSSPAAFKRAQQWLSYCEEHDEACHPPNPGFVPRRLVDVGSWDGSREPFLFEPTTPVRYACLSYCWGKDLDQVLTTTTNNIHSHYQAIALSALPLALQDAIMVCRNLKIPNLWVDSICIVQDDMQAWLQDASTMHDVYLNSYLTIAVMEPNSCKSKFLGKQRFGDPSWQQLFRPCLPNTGKETTPMDWWIRPGKYPISHEHRFSLDQRGWCLQESVLPNRRLCYTGNEMIWGCVCRQVCECGHTVAPQMPMDTTPDYGQLGGLLKSRILKGDFSLDKLRVVGQGCNRSIARTQLSPHHVVYQSWRNLVTDYSYRSLSKKHDRLRAISGLARMVWDHLQHESDMRDEETDATRCVTVEASRPAGRAMKWWRRVTGRHLPTTEPSEQYLAGLWKWEVHFDLAWEVQPLEDSVEAPESGEESLHEAGYSVPSWSWASVERPVTCRFSDFLPDWQYPEHPRRLQDQCILENAFCQNELPEDPMSAVTGGHIVLRGTLAPVELLRRNRDERSWDSWYHSYCIKQPGIFCLDYGRAGGEGDAGQT